MRVPCAAELLCARIPHAAVAWKRVGFVARRFADEKRVFLPCQYFGVSLIVIALATAIGQALRKICPSVFALQNGGRG